LNSQKYKNQRKINKKKYKKRKRVRVLFCQFVISITFNIKVKRKIKKMRQNLKSKKVALSSFSSSIPKNLHFFVIFSQGA